MQKIIPIFIIPKIAAVSSASVKEHVFQTCLMETAQIQALSHPTRILAPSNSTRIFELKSIQVRCDRVGIWVWFEGAGIREVVKKLVIESGVKEQVSESCVKEPVSESGVKEPIFVSILKVSESVHVSIYCQQLHEKEYTYDSHQGCEYSFVNTTKKEILQSEIRCRYRSQVRKSWCPRSVFRRRYPSRVWKSQDRYPSRVWRSLSLFFSTCLVRAAGASACSPCAAGTYYGSTGARRLTLMQRYTHTSFITIGKKAGILLRG